MRYFPLLLLSIALFWIGCNSNPSVSPIHPVWVLYENDVHCAIDGYARLATLKEAKLSVSPFVTTVTCGDFVQGDVVGSLSHGEHIVRIMNAVGYDVVALGNHEFDFGLPQLFRLTDSLDATVVCANFRHQPTDSLLFPPYQILSYDNVQIAYIGFITTATIGLVAPSTFQDSIGQFCYDFSHKRFYEQAQHYIDDARKQGADYVVALSHLGDTKLEGHPNSIDLITNTDGIDVVIDGHSHSIIADTLISNKLKKEVLLTSTGNKFSNIGLLKLDTDGCFSTQLIPNSDTTLIDNTEIKSLTDSLQKKVLTDGKKVIGTNLQPLLITNPENERLIRNRETTIGNLCADAFRCVLHTDIALINSGCIRADLPQGPLTLNQLHSAFPFDNNACIATLTGNQLLDVLEFSVRMLPQAYSEFMQVSGLKFQVDTSIPSPATLDENELFSHITSGARRISQLQILDPQSGHYLPVDTARTYTLGGLDYQIKQMGSQGVLRYAKLISDNRGSIIQVLTTYIEKHLNGVIGKQYAQTEGRIVIDK